MRHGRSKKTALETTEEQKRSDLLDLYKVAVEEYRFQILLNWDRAKYFLVFNTAIIAAGAGLLKLGGKNADEVLIGFFTVGFASSIISMFAVNLQHKYYRTTRDNMSHVGDELNVGDLGVATTPGARSERKTLVQKLGKIQNILYVLLTFIAAVDAVAIIYTATR